MIHTGLGRVLSFAAAAAFVACASSSGSDATARAAASSGRIEPHAALSGTWGFVLASSDVAKDVRERCAREHATSDACWNEIATEAAREKIRFTTDASGHTSWRSFAQEGAEEILFVEVPIELSEGDPGWVIAKVAGEAHGERAKKFATSGIDSMRIEVVDAKTIAMIDPTKGRLVFAKE